MIIHINRSPGLVPLIKNIALFELITCNQVSASGLFLTEPAAPVGDGYNKPAAGAQHGAEGAQCCHALSVAADMSKYAEQQKHQITASRRYLTFKRVQCVTNDPEATAFDRVLIFQ